MRTRSSTPTSTVENYLKTLYTMQQRADDGLVPLGKLAEAMGVTPGTVTIMIKGLAQSGHVDYEIRRGTSLTPKGEKIALHVLRHHRLIELFLVKIIGLDWSEVHEDAEVLEHAISDKLLARIDEMLGYPTLDPHGDPIPEASGKMTHRRLQPLSQSPLGTVQIARVDDHAPSFLRFLQDHGLTPGTDITVLSQDATAQVVSIQRANEDPIHIGTAVADKILITTDAHPDKFAVARYEPRP